MAVYDAGLNNGAFLRLIVEENSQNISGNTSTNGFQLELHRGSNTSSWTAGPVYWTVTINGALFHGSFSFSTGSGAIVIYNNSIVVGHNSDGTKSTSVQASLGDTGTAIGGPTNISATFVQTTIPRASTPSFRNGVGTSITNLDAGELLLIDTNRASSSFTHTVKYSIGAANGAIATGVTTGTSWTIPLSLMNQIPAATSGVLTITLETYSGATLIGTKSSNLTMKVPSSIVPDFTTISNSEATAGLAANVGAYVQGMTTLALAFSGAAGAYGSTIKSSSISVNGQTLSSATGLASGTTSAITASGTVVITGTITDTRNRVRTKTVNITVLAYSPPTLTSILVERATAGGVPDDNGTYLNVSINASVQSLINTTQRNALNYRISTRPRSGGGWTVKANTAPGGVTMNSTVTIGTSYLITQAYDVLVEIYDDFVTSALLRQVATATIFIHYDGDEGMGLGQYRTGLGILEAAGIIYQLGLPVVDFGDLATTSTPGIVPLATNAATQTGTATDSAVTPASLSARTATETRTGILETATAAEAAALSALDKIMTPGRMNSALAAQERPMCKVTKSSAQNTLASNAQSAVVWNTEVFDTASMHSTASNQSRVNIVRSGYYFVKASVRVFANTQYSGIQLAVNGTPNQTAIDAYDGMTTNNQWPKDDGLIYLNSGDYLEVLVRCAAGVAPLIVANCWFDVMWVAA